MTIPCQSAFGVFALLTLTCATALEALGGALWRQRKGFVPGLLCILQRMAYLSVLGFALSRLVLLRAGVPRRSRF